MKRRQRIKRTARKKQQRRKKQQAVTPPRVAGSESQKTVYRKLCAHSASGVSVVREHQHRGEPWPPRMSSWSDNLQHLGRGQQQQNPSKQHSTTTTKHTTNSTATTTTRPTETKANQCKAVQNPLVMTPFGGHLLKKSLNKTKFKSFRNLRKC